MASENEQRYERIADSVNLMLGSSFGGVTSERMRDLICKDARDIATLERVLFHKIDSGTVIAAHDDKENITYYMLWED